MTTVQGAGIPGLNAEVERAIVLVLHAEHFGHVLQEYRGKVARDLRSHLGPGNKWDYEHSNLLNDYQRHLYALFLKLAGIPYEGICEELRRVSADVSPRQMEAYILDVLHSSIVGFPDKVRGQRNPHGVAV